MCELFTCGTEEKSQEVKIRGPALLKGLAGRPLNRAVCVCEDWVMMEMW